MDKRTFKWDVSCCTNLKGKQKSLFINKIEQGRQKLRDMVLTYKDTFSALN
jgi:hypothetical protein